MGTCSAEPGSGLCPGSVLANGWNLLNMILYIISSLFEPFDMPFGGVLTTNQTHSWKELSCVLDMVECPYCGRDKRT